MAKNNIAVLIFNLTKQLNERIEGLQKLTGTLVFGT